MKTKLQQVSLNWKRHNLSASEVDFCLIYWDSIGESHPDGTLQPPEISSIRQSTDNERLARSKQEMAKRCA